MLDISIHIYDKAWTTKPCGIQINLEKLEQFFNKVVSSMLCNQLTGGITKLSGEFARIGHEI